MFWLRNEKNNLMVRTLIWWPGRGGSVLVFLTKPIAIPSPSPALDPPMLFIVVTSSLTLLYCQTSMMIMLFFYFGLPRQDGCKARKDTKYFTTKQRPNTYLQFYAP